MKRIEFVQPKPRIQDWHVKVESQAADIACVGMLGEWPAAPDSYIWTFVMASCRHSACARWRGGVNENAPEPKSIRDPSRLAKVLGRFDEEVVKAIPAVLPFFIEMDGFYSSPELDSYKLHLQTSRKLMSEGGKKSAAKRAGKTT